jgi:hypothetical protein
MLWAVIYQLLDKLYYRKSFTFGRRYGGDGKPGA